MRAKSGVWNGSVLDFANGLEADSVAEAAGFAFGGAARAGWAVIAIASDADVSKR